VLLGVGVGVGVTVGAGVAVDEGLELLEADAWVVPVEVAELVDCDGVAELESDEFAAVGVLVLVSLGVSVGVAVGEASTAFCAVSADVSTVAFAGGESQTDWAAELVAWTANTLIIPALKNTAPTSAPSAAGFESSALTCATSLQVAVPARRSPPLRKTPSRHTTHGFVYNCLT